MVSRTKAWLVWGVVSLFYAYQYVLRVMPNIMLEDIMQQFHIDASVFGQFAGLYYLGYVGMHIPLGLLLDRYGPQYVMSGCMALCALGLSSLLFSDHWSLLLVGRFLVGMGSSAAVLGLFNILRIAFKEKQFTRMLSLSVTIGLLGAIYGGSPVSSLCALLGYKSVIQIFSVVGLIMAAFSYVMIPAMKASTTEGVLSSMRLVLTNRHVTILCFLSGLMVAPLEGFADVWGSVFLKTVYGLDNDISNFLPSMIFIGMCFGAPVLSAIAEKTGRYVASILGCGILMLLVFSALIARILTVESMIIAFLVVGVACAYQILAIYKASTYVPSHVSGLTTAIANMIIMSFGYIFHAVMGSVVDLSGGTKSCTALLSGISVIPIALAVGVVGFFFLAYKESPIKR